MLKLLLRRQILLLCPTTMHLPRQHLVHLKRAWLNSLIEVIVRLLLCWCWHGQFPLAFNLLASFVRLKCGTVWGVTLLGGVQHSEYEAPISRYNQTFGTQLQSFQNPAAPVFDGAVGNRALARRRHRRLFKHSPHVVSIGSKCHHGWQDAGPKKVI